MSKSSAITNAAQSMSALEELGRGNSFLHRLPAGSKLFVTFLYIILLVSFPPYNLGGLLPFVFYPAFLVPLSNTPWRPLFKRSAFALPFALAMGISNIILLREPALVLGPLIISSGLVSCISIFFKTWLSVFACLLLIATTPFNDLAAILTTVKGLRVLGLQIILTYRYISTLLNEAGNMYCAYILRAPGFKGLRLSDMGTFCGQLLLRSFDKAERVYYAMKCRGFEGVYYGESQNREERRGGNRLLSGFIYCFILCFLFVFFRFVNFSRLIGGVL
jgi:cobalt/nickel transport system permease protein